jgi:hypothetical protein
MYLLSVIRIIFAATTSDSPISILFLHGIKQIKADLFVAIAVAIRFEREILIRVETTVVAVISEVQKKSSSE